MRSRRRAISHALAVALTFGSLVSTAPVGAAAGALDPGFGTSGIVQTDVTDGDVAADLVVQPDGKAITVGADGAVLLRHRTDGSLDPTFGVGGVVRSSNQAAFSDGLLQPDGKIVIVGIDGMRDDAAIFRYLPNGAPDPSFGSGGEVRTDFGAVDRANAVALQTDGRLVVAGTSGGAVALARYLPGGTLDPTFGVGGRTTTTFEPAGTPVDATSIATLSTGGFAVGGRALPLDGPLTMLLARYTPAGTLDPTYGQGGRVAPAEQRLSNVTSLLVQAGDRVVVAGARSVGGTQVQAIGRYLPGGSVDPTFGAGGSTETPLGGFSSAVDLTADAAGRLLTAARVMWSDTFDQLTVSRFSADGVTDAGFGCAGSTQVELAAALGGIGAGIGVAPDGRILVNGTAYTDATPGTFGRPDFVLVRLLADGPNDGGYWITRADGGVSAFGDAGACGSLRGLPTGGAVVDHAARPSRDGYWIAFGDGSVATRGDAPNLGSARGLPLNRPVLGMAATPSGAGYWLVAGDGGIFSFGDARFFGSTGGTRLNQPVVGMASTPTGNGYWLVARDGGIFAFGDARFFGSTGSIALNRPIVGMTTTASGTGYWLGGADGGIFAFGAAPFLGSTGGQPFTSRAVAVT